MKRRVPSSQRWRFANFLLLLVNVQCLDGGLIKCLTLRHLEYFNYKCAHLFVQPVDLE